MSDQTKYMRIAPEALEAGDFLWMDEATVSSVKVIDRHFWSDVEVSFKESWQTTRSYRKGTMTVDIKRSI